MFSLERLVAGATVCALVACGGDRSVDPVAAKVDADNGVGIESANVVTRFDLLVGQRVTIKPRTTTRLSRLRWSSTNTGVASVNSTGTVTANATGTATVTVSGGWVAENYTVAVTAPAAPPAPTVTAFTLQPATGVNLLPGQTQQFAPAATWSDGQQYPLSVTYSATGGTISSTGSFTAGSTAGRFSVLATCVCGLVATSTLDVAQLTTLRISPKTVSLAAGAAQAFTTTALWSTGATTLPPITYSVTGGSITSTGQYTAPSTAGTYRVIVAHTNGTARDTATVTVTGGGTGGEGTPPAGAVQVLFFDGFETGNFTKTQNGILWTSTPWMDVSGIIGRTGSRSARFRQGDSKEWAELRFGGLPNLKEVYLQYWLYQPNGAESTPVGVDVQQPGGRNDKFFRLWGGNYDAENDIKFGASTWGGRLGVEFKRSQPDGTIWPMGEGGDPTRPDVLSYHPFVGNPAYKGRWVKVQIRCKASTQNVSDGVIQIWIDGVRVLSRTNLAAWAGTGGNDSFRAGYLLGWANNGFPAGQFMYLDDFTISTGGFP